MFHFFAHAEPGNSSGETKTNKKSQEVLNLIVDTDLGDDIDDIFAVSLALQLHRVGEVNLQYLITSGKGEEGHEIKRAILLRRLCRAILGNNEEAWPKIICGLKVTKEIKVTKETKKTGLGYLDTTAEAIDFPQFDQTLTEIQETIEANFCGEEQKTTVLCIGPLNNITKLKCYDKVSLVLMGGSFGKNFDNSDGQIVEYNVKEGVKAWQEVLQKYHHISIVPLDIAGSARIPNWKELMSNLTGPSNTTRNRDLRELLSNRYTQWFNGNKQCTDNEIMTKDQNGKSIDIEEAEYSNIQFDSVAFFYCLYGRVDDVNKAITVEKVFVEVSDEGLTTIVDEGAREGAREVSIAKEWIPESPGSPGNPGGLNLFRLWFARVLFLPDQ